MKKILIVLAMFCVVTALRGAYNAGDIITEDIQFTDFSWHTGELVTTQQSVLDLVAENKTVILYFTQITYD